MADALDTYTRDIEHEADWDDLFLSITHEAVVLWGPPRSRILLGWMDKLHDFPELAELALLIGLSPNLTHLKVGTNFREQINFLEFLGISYPYRPGYRPTPPFQGLPKCKRFTLLIWGKDLPHYVSCCNYPADRARKETMEKLPIPP
jgi:hypothetical protein